jgi:membrane AbrB-like protein
VARCWLLLGLASVLVAALFEVLRVPGAFLLGPLLAAATLAAKGVPCIVPGPMFRLAQAIIGLLIARTLAADTMAELLRDWPLFLGGVVSVIAASSLIGWALARWRVLPGTTAVWGAAPGGATAMIVMSGSFGADTRLVALMQYLRVVTVVVVATLVARIWTGESTASHAPMVLFPPLDLWAVVATLLLAVGGAQLGQALRLPAGAMLIPMMLGAILNTTGVITIELPPWLLAPTYAVIGWQVGSRFERSILRHALRALPALLVATAALIGACAGFAALLVLVADVPPLTAYLATSPGGIDSVAIIGMAGQADMQFVMAMQTARFLVVMVTGPWIASRVAGSIARRAAGSGKRPGTAPEAR